MDRETLVSKALSKLLRHRAEEAGLTLDAEGYIRLDQVVSFSFFFCFFFPLLLCACRDHCHHVVSFSHMFPGARIEADGYYEQLQYGPVKSLKTTIEDVHAACATNAKQRFALKPNPASSSPSLAEAKDWFIRANQGHSIALASEGLLVPITLADLGEGEGKIPEKIVHGTYFAFWDDILASGGLSRMGRNHVHFSVGLPAGEGEVVSGMRGDAELLIWVDLRKSLEGGALRWWRSDNGVVLTEGDERGFVCKEFWTKTEGRKMGVGVLWEDGVVVSELSEEARKKSRPSGKRGGAAERERGRGGGRNGGGRGRGRGGRGHGGREEEGGVRESAVEVEEGGL